MMGTWRHIDLFSGIGGFALAASWVWTAHEVVTFCEIDPFCQKVIGKHWPGVPIHGDIKTLDGRPFAGVDLLTGGFPCQPYSVAGKQGGATDDRALWPEMFRVIREARPRWIVGENVTGIVAMALDGVLSDLEGEGYSVGTFVIPACAVNAPHRRDRVWIVANSGGRRLGRAGGGEVQFERGAEAIGGSEAMADSEGGQLQRQRRAGSLAAATGDVEAEEDQRQRGGNAAVDCGADCWSTGRFLAGRRVPESGIRLLAHGIPGRVARLKALGNAIVPQVAAEIFRAIQACDFRVGDKS